MNDRNHGMAMSVEITEANTSDISLLSNLIRKSHQDVASRFNLTLKNAPTHPSNCTDEWIVTDFQKGKRYFILKVVPEARGCVAIENANEKVFYLERLGVLLEYRNKGYGTALIDHVKNEMRKKGAKRIEIGIIGENVELKEWYEKREFIFKEHFHLNHLPFTVCIMYYDLNQPKTGLI